jgi:hypothetical protein
VRNGFAGEALNLTPDLVIYMGREAQNGRTDPRVLTEEDARIADGLMQALSGELTAQVNPTYPAGDSRYGQPMSVGGQPMSLNESEYGWTQRMNELRRSSPDAYKKVKSMMGPHGWTQAPSGFAVPSGI